MNALIDDRNFRAPLISLIRYARSLGGGGMYRESITRLTRSPLEENDIAPVQAYLRHDETVEPFGYNVPGYEGTVSIIASIAIEFSIPRTTLAFVRNVLITPLIDRAHEAHCC